MDGRDDDGIASGCPGASPKRHRIKHKRVLTRGKQPQSHMKGGWEEKEKLYRCREHKFPAVGLHCYRNYVPAVATFKVQLDRYV